MPTLPSTRSRSTATQLAAPPDSLQQTVGTYLVNCMEKDLEKALAFLGSMAVASADDAVEGEGI